MGDGITYCNDARQLPKHVRAEKIPFTNGLPKDRTTVIDRSQPILVQRQVDDPDASVLDMQTIGTITQVGSGEPGAEPVFAERPDGYADDPPLQKAASMENGIGVDAPPHTTTVLNGQNSMPEALPSPPAVVGRRKRTTHAGPPVPAEPRDGVLVPTSPPERTIPRAVPAVTTEKPKVRVRLSNKGMGRLTVSVQHAAVSSSLVVLAYPKDADNIAEPPEADSENPITVEIGEKAYKCMFGGWTVEMEQLFLVVLVRLPD